MALSDQLVQEEIENTGMLDGEPIWLPLVGGGEAHVTYLGNPEFVSKLRRLENVYRKQHLLKPNEEIKEEEREGLVREAAVGTILKAIRGVEERPGVELPSTPAGLRRLLEIRVQRERILGYAGARETFQRENLEIVLGNSEESSAGS